MSERLFHATIFELSLRFPCADTCTARADFGPRLRGMAYDDEGGDERWGEETESRNTRGE